MGDIREAINAQIAQMEQDFDVTVLFACDYGSRVWGLESESSDYDIRMIYKDPPHRAFALYNDRELIQQEVILNDADKRQHQVDLIGWSLPKALKLAQVSNPQILEFLASPHIYRSNPCLSESLEEITAQYSPRIMAHYYRGIAKKNYLGRMVHSQKQDVKTALQTVRCLMMSRLLVETGGDVPPMKFDSLLEQNSALWSTYHRENLLPQIRELVSLKVDEGWDYTYRHYPTLMNWAIAEITALDTDVMSLPDEPVPGETVEAAFRLHYPETFGARIDAPPEPEF